MNEKTIIYICILNGILMLINPIIAILLFFEGSSNVIIIFLYSSFYAGVSLILAGILVQEDYSNLGIDYLKTGINVLTVAIILDIVSLIALDILIFLNLEGPIILSIIDILIYNLIEAILIVISILIIRKFKKALDTHEHGKEFSH